MQTILGSGGAIGIELARALPQFTQEIRLVSRNPKSVNSGDQLVSANLKDSGEVLKAVEGSEVVYLTVGLTYTYKIWQKDWPLIMENVINACKQNNAKLFFFDNIYMYDSNYLNPMTEATPINPPSKKGKVRLQVLEMIEKEMRQGTLTALVARSADFYGPSIQTTCMLTETVFNNFASGKKANWLGSVNYKHSFTYTPDAGKATALLGNTPDAFNQIWHLPTSSDPLTGKEMIKAIASEMGVEPKFQVAPKFLVRIMGLFIPIMRELVEMIYQYDRDYVFDSSKFDQKFGVKPTPYLEGIKEVVKQDYSKNA
jgi:nucleoside-diphosphate-sugar epimerase